MGEQPMKEMVVEIDAEKIDTIYSDMVYEVFKDLVLEFMEEYNLDIDDMKEVAKEIIWSNEE